MHSYKMHPWLPHIPCSLAPALGISFILQLVQYKAGGIIILSFGDLGPVHRGDQSKYCAYKGRIKNVFS